MESQPVSDPDRERRERFARLPARVLPDESVESVDTRRAPGRPDSAVSEAQAFVIGAGG
jgi:hypothetical protein